METKSLINTDKYAADISSIREAQNRIKPFIHKTPIVTSETLNAMSGRKIFFKCECFKRATQNVKSCLAESLPIPTRRREVLIISTFSSVFSISTLPRPFFASASSSSSSSSEFLDLPNSGGVKALDLRIGSGEIPVDGDQVAIHYYGRLGAKQGWRFDSTYDHKDDTGEPIPFVFVLGSANFRSAVLPLDVAKIIIQTSPDKSFTRSPIPVLNSINRSAGIKGCYAGLGPTIVRAFPANAAAIVAWELGMKILGIRHDILRYSYHLLRNRTRTS